MLRESTAGSTGSEISESLEALGAEYDTYVGFRHSGVTISSTSLEFDKAFSIGAATVTSPTFPPAALSRVRTTLLANIEARSADPVVLAFDLMARAIFGENSRYAHPVDGRASTVAGITRDDILAWYRGRYSPSGAVVVLVGDITSGRARSLVESTLGKWSTPVPRRIPSDTIGPQNPTTTPTRIVLVDRPGAKQSAVVVGKATISPTDPRYYAFLILNRVLGVGVSSRLNRNLREKHGYTYGVTSFVEARRGLSLFSIEGSMRDNATDSALVELIREFDQLGGGDIAPAELEIAKSSLVGSFPASMQSAQTVRGRITNLLAWGAPTDYYANYRDRLNAVTPQFAASVAKQIFTRQSLVIVVVGDATKLEQKLRSLRLGNVEVWTESGERIR
jgi:zinc protease